MFSTNGVDLAVAEVIEAPSFVYALIYVTKILGRLKARLRRENRSQSQPHSYPCTLPICSRVSLTNFSGVRLFRLFFSGYLQVPRRRSSTDWTSRFLLSFYSYFRQFFGLSDLISFPIRQPP